MFVLQSEIHIGSFKFSGVNEVKIKRSIHSLIDTATIKIPAKSRVLDKEGKNTDDVVTATKFKIGDQVTISLGYDGKLKEEFRGFVSEVKPNTPLEIECEGYSYQLKKQTIMKSWPKAKLKDILADIVKGTDIKVQIDDYSNIELLNIQGASKSALEMIDVILKASQKALDAWFIEPDLLRIGFIYVPDGEVMKDVLEKPQVKYRIGFNALQDNNLKVKAPKDLKIVVKNAENKRDRSANPDADKTIRTYVLNKMPKDAIQKIQDALRLKESYKGYEGKITGFLQPFCLPGYKAYITDSRYTDRDGDYFIESIEVSYGVIGARRVVEVGPKLSTR